MEVPPGKPAARALPAASAVGSRGLDSNGMSFDEDEDVEMALRTPLASANGPGSGADELTHRPHYVSWASASDEDDDRDDNEELAPRLRRLPVPPRPSTPNSAELCLAHGPDTRGGCPTSPALTLAARPIPVWLHGRCCSCLAAPCGCLQRCLRCSRCLENGHLARECRKPWRPLSSLACLVVPRLGIEHHQASASREGPMKSALPSEALRHESWASVVSGITGSAALSDVELQSALTDQSKLLQGLLACVGSFLEQSEVALGKLSLVPAMLPTASTWRPPAISSVGSAEDKGTKLFGCYSPRVGVGSSSLSVVPLCRLLLRARPSSRSSPLCCRSCPSFNGYV